MKKKILIIIFILLFGITAFFLLENKWRYEDKIVQEFFTSASFHKIYEKSQSIDPSIIDRYYLGDALFTTRTRAHNETTDSSKPPYRISIIVDMLETANIDKVIFHNVTLVSSLGRSHEFHPTERNKKGESTKALSFPVTIKSDEFRLEEIGKRRWFSLSLASLYDLNFDPKSDESIDIQIDAEIFNNDGSERKILKHTIEPRSESGSITLPTI